MYEIRKGPGFPANSARSLIHSLTTIRCEPAEQARQSRMSVKYMTVNL